MTIDISKYNKPTLEGYYIFLADGLIDPVITKVELASDGVLVSWCGDDGEELSSLVGKWSKKLEIL